MKTESTTTLNTLEQMAVNLAKETGATLPEARLAVQAELIKLRLGMKQISRERARQMLAAIGLKLAN